MPRLLAVLSLLLALGAPLAAAGSSAQYISGAQGPAPSPPGNCPFGTSYVNDNGVGDGCAGSITTADFQVPLATFQAQAEASGQTWPNGHPMNWNVAGVDYPIGYDTTLTMKIPGVNTPPLGCAYAAPQMTCQAGTSQGAQCQHNIDFEGWRFVNQTLVIEGGNCPVANGGTFTLNNVQFQNGSTIQSGGFFVEPFGGVDSDYNLVISNFDMDGGDEPTSTLCSGAPCTVDKFRAISAGFYGNLTLKYGVIQNTTGRQITWNGQATAGTAPFSTTIYYFYTTGATSATLEENDHIETVEQIAAANSTIDLIDYEFDTCLAQTWQTVANTSCWFPATGQSNNVTFSLLKVYNNVFAINNNNGSTIGKCSLTGTIPAGSFGVQAQLTVSAIGTCAGAPIGVGTNIQNAGLWCCATANNSQQATIAAVITPWNGTTAVYALGADSYAPSTLSGSININFNINSGTAVEINRNSYGTIIIHNNYLDHTGGTNCFAQASVTAVGTTDWGTTGAGTANYSLTTGNALFTGTTSGTASPANGWAITPGTPGCN